MKDRLTDKSPEFVYTENLQKPELEKNGVENDVDLVSISTKSNIERCRKNCIVLNDSDYRVAKMIKCLGSYDERVDICEHLCPDDIDIQKAEDVKRFAEDEIHDMPTIIYTAQCLETDNDVVSGGFYGCCFIEIFIPNQKRHLAFHLPAEFNPMKGTGSYALWTPDFFHTYLHAFMERNKCSFETLQITIVSGVMIPPNEIKASFLALGCDDENINCLQLPINDFSVMTFSQAQSILLRGDRAEYLEPSEAPPRGQILRVTGGREEFDILLDKINILI